MKAALGRLTAAVLVVVGAALVLTAGDASAHHTTIVCSSPGVWNVTNSEPIAMTFTSPQGPSGSIGPDGTVQVPYSGTSLTIVGVWSNGFQQTSSGEGQCTVVTTTTTTTESSTTTSSTTTLPETTTTTTTTVPTTSTTSSTTTTSSTSSTTTSPETTTTSTVPVDVAAVGAVCSRDTPYIDVTFGPQIELNGEPATINLIAVDGTVVATFTVPFEASTTVRLLWPGATVDENGTPTDWPGWLLNDAGFWVEDPTDAFLREGLTVAVDVNPTATATVEYPPPTPACDANPPDETPPCVPLAEATPSDRNICGALAATR